MFPTMVGQPGHFFKVNMGISSLSNYIFKSIIEYTFNKPRL